MSFGPIGPRIASLASQAKFRLRLERRRLARKLRLTDAPIRIVFLATDPLDWLSLHSLYAACAASPRFDANIIDIGFRGWLDFDGNCGAFFRAHNIAFYDASDGRDWLAALMPDVIVTATPYDQYQFPPYRSDRLCAIARLAYIPYGVDFADGFGQLQQQIYANAIQRSAWRVFTRSEATRPLYRTWGIADAAVVALGLPVIDHYYSDLLAEPLPEAFRAHNKDRFKILYTPHHALGGWSTFPQHAATIRAMVMEDERLSLVFRPHPGLGPTLKLAGLMDEAEFAAFFSGPRMLFHSASDYYSAFRWSDALVSDASSFLVQYAPTGKPVVYLDRPDGWGLDAGLDGDVRSAYYCVSDAEALRATLLDLAAGDDPLAAARHEGQQRMCVGLSGPGAGARIADHIARALG